MNDDDYYIIPGYHRDSGKTLNYRISRDPISPEKLNLTV